MTSSRLAPTTLPAVAVIQFLEMGGQRLNQVQVQAAFQWAYPTTAAPLPALRGALSSRHGSA